MFFELNEMEKKFLLTLARQAIQNFFGGKHPNRTKKYFSTALQTKCGAFVTLDISGDLRGCIGYAEGIIPLQDAIADLAVAAAFNDPRFFPLTEAEFTKTNIEISVLSPLIQIADISEIEIGRDGLLIKRGRSSGLLLPQVATEYNWDAETFLKQTCLKAGLPANMWSEPNTHINRFSANIFSESQFLSEQE